MPTIDLVIVQKIFNLLNRYKRFRDKYYARDRRWKKLIRNKEKVIFRLKNGFDLNLYADSLLSKLIYDGFEDMEEAFLKNYLQEGDIFFDIGANIGFHTINASSILKNNGKIYAFEPTPSTFQRLLENISLNKLEEKVKAFNIGLSNENSLLNLHISSPGFDAFNSFADLKYVQNSGVQQIPVFTAEHIIKEENIDVEKIALIKIDVEGWELHVLKGMENLFKVPSFAPCFLIEFTEENIFRAGHSCNELYRFMEDKGYKWYTYSPQLNAISLAERKAYYVYENLIAAKNVELLTSRLKKTNLTIGV